MTNAYPPVGWCCRHSPLAAETVTCIWLVTSGLSRLTAMTVSFVAAGQDAATVRRPLASMLVLLSGAPMSVHTTALLGSPVTVAV